MISSIMMHVVWNHLLLQTLKWMIITFERSSLLYVSEFDDDDDDVDAVVDNTNDVTGTTTTFIIMTMMVMMSIVICTKVLAIYNLKGW